jgi:hypothetical protein
LKLRFLNKKIAAAFRPTKLVLNSENLYSNMDHIKTIHWPFEKYYYHDITRILNHYYNITKVISDSDEYDFKDWPYVKKLVCSAQINVMSGGSYSALTYYKGPYNKKLFKFKELKIIHLTSLCDSIMIFNEKLEKLIVDNDVNLSLSDTSIKFFTIKGSNNNLRLELPKNLKLIRISFENI